MHIIKILFIDTAHPALEKGLVDMGFLCDTFPDATRSDLLRLVHEYEGIVIRSKIPIDSEFLSYARKLRFIARVGAGMENIDVEAAEQRGVVCLNAPEGNRDAVGEQAIGMLLALMNNLMVADREVRQGIWQREKNRGFELGGKTVAVIGYGNTGSAFVRKLSGFGVRLLAYDKYKHGFGSDLVVESDMKTIFEEADVLSLHVPLTEETRYLVNRGYFESFRKPIWLVNTARGPVVNTAHLMDMIEQGKVLGACLDVLEYEKFSFEDLPVGSVPDVFRRLSASERVVLSPHIAGWTHESNLRMAQVLLKKIAELYGLKY
jgi:D-3-phosphoglycerate dehydrogenase / 2-oxoglutarate reductase